MWQPSQQCVPNFTETFWKIYSHFLCSQFGFGGTWCSYILTLSSTFGMNLKTGSHPYHQHQWLTSLILLWLNENKISAVRCKNLVKSLEEKKKKNRRLLKVFAPCWFFLFKIIFFLHIWHIYMFQIIKQHLSKYRTHFLYEDFIFHFGKRSSVSLPKPRTDYCQTCWLNKPLK